MLANYKKYQSFIILLVATIAFVVVYSQIFDEKLDQNGDNANYYILGKALAGGDGFVNINNIHKTPNNHFPPGYPVIISAVIKVFGDNARYIKVANGLFLYLTLIALYLLIKKISNKTSTAVIVLILVMMNSHLLRYSAIMMTEIPFLFFSTLTILSFTKIKYKRPAWQDRYLYVVIALLSISLHIRTSGVALILGIILFLVFRRHWKHATIIALGVLLLALPWQIRNNKIGGSSYVKQLKMVNPYRPELGKAGPVDYFSRFANNLNRYLTKEIPSATLSIAKPNYRQASSFSEWLYGLLLFIIIIFGILNLKKFRLLILAYLAGTLIILSLWPDVWIGSRFILPAVPFLLVGLVNGLQEILLRVTPQTVRIYILWLPLIISIFLFSGIKSLSREAKAEIKPEWTNYYSLASWLKENKGDEIVVACRKPGLFYLYSNSYTINYKYTTNDQELIKDLKEKRVEYVVLDQLGYSSTSRYLYPAIQNNPEVFELIQERNNPETYLFRRK